MSGRTRRDIFRLPIKKGLWHSRPFNHIFAGKDQHYGFHISDRKWKKTDR
jgi:hypothetical protein